MALNVTTQRDYWTFPFPASRLAEACKEKIAFHKSRREFWEKAKAKVMEEVRSTGIEVSESEAGSNYTKGGRCPEVMVRNDLQKRLVECHNKITEHHDATVKYEGWEQVLSGNPAQQLDLSASDYLFFFGK